MDDFRFYLIFNIWGNRFFVRNHLTKFVKIIDSSSEYISWIKIAKQFHNFSEDILIGAVYIPPQQSKFFNEDEYEFFEQEIASACSSDKYTGQKKLSPTCIFPID